MIESVPLIPEAKCCICGGPKEDQYRDLVGFATLLHPYVGSEARIIVVFCNSCACDLVALLLDRFYPVWGDGPLFERVRSEIVEECARVVEEHHVGESTESHMVGIELASAIRDLVRS